MHTVAITSSTLSTERGTHCTVHSCEAHVFSQIENKSFYTTTEYSYGLRLDNYYHVLSRWNTAFFFTFFIITYFHEVWTFNTVAKNNSSCGWSFIFFNTRMQTSVRLETHGTAMRSTRWKPNMSPWWQSQAFVPSENAARTQRDGFYFCLRLLPLFAQSHLEHDGSTFAWHGTGERFA